MTAGVGTYTSILDFEADIDRAAKNGRYLHSWTIDMTKGLWIVAVYLPKEKLQDITNFGKVTVSADGKVVVNG